MSNEFFQMILLLLLIFCSEKGLNAVSSKHALSSCKTFKQFYIFLLVANSF